MTFARTLSIIALAAMATTAAAVYAAGADTRIAQATPPAQGMGMGMGGPAAMPGYAEQMKAMQAMHEKMAAAKTPQERNALMAEQMKLMQQGMAMMGRMGGGAMMGGGPGAMRPGGDTASRPGTTEQRMDMMQQRMDMMQSMMQMMMDRMTPAPATK
ncbi:MAG: hypothetical protein KIT17_25385 [Rubrivivax sp.]|nr:hypothetical protein [Rubrivivax sp.]